VDGIADSASGAFIPMKSFNAVVDVVESWHRSTWHVIHNSYGLLPLRLKGIKWLHAMELLDNHLQWWSMKFPRVRGFDVWEGIRIRL